MPRILFCNIAYMEYYDLIIYPNDTPKHGGSYVKDTGSAFESWNFHRYPDGYYGFVETKYTKKQTAVEQYARQLHIERIDPEAAGDSVDHVMVLFCAHSDAVDETVLVGWYPDATVYRRRRKHEDGHTCCFICLNACATRFLWKNWFTPPNISRRRPSAPALSIGGGTAGGAWGRSTGS